MCHVWWWSTLKYSVVACRHSYYIQYIDIDSVTTLKVFYFDLSFCVFPLILEALKMWIWSRYFKIAHQNCSLILFYLPVACHITRNTALRMRPFKKHIYARNPVFFIPILLTSLTYTRCFLFLALLRLNGRERSVRKNSFYCHFLFDAL